MVLGLFKCCGGAGDCTCQQADWLPQCRCYSLSSAGGIRGAAWQCSQRFSQEVLQELDHARAFHTAHKSLEEECRWWKSEAGGRDTTFSATPLDPNTGRSCFGGNTWNWESLKFLGHTKFGEPKAENEQRVHETFRELEGEWTHPFCFAWRCSPHTEMDGLMVLSMRSICTSLPVDSSQLLLLAIPKTIITEEMWEEVWDALVWSFEAMAQGKMPVSGPQGGSLPLWLQNQKGKQMPKGMVYAITGDLEFYYSEFGLPRPNQEHPCAWCRCNQGSRPWNDFRNTAAWRRKLLTPAELCESLGGHKIFGVSGVNPLAISLDTLHTIDLGVACHAIGNLLWEICESKAGNRDTSMAELNKEIQEIYTKLNIPSGQRVGHLKWKDLAKSNSEYPVLKHVKARNGLWDGNGLESPSKYFWNGLGSPSRLARVGKP